MIEEIKLSEEQREKLKNMVSEAVNSLYRIQSEKDLIKDISTRSADELGIKKAKFNKLARNIYQDSCKKLDEETTALLDLAEEIGLYSHSDD